MFRVGHRGTARLRLRRRRGFIVAWALVAGLSGCKKGDDQASIVCDRETYIERSSQFGPEEGEGIVTAREDAELALGEFEKPYNPNWLMAVGRASIVDTIRYIEGKGAKVYRSEPVSARSSLNLTAAAPMPEDLDREWRRSDHPLAGSVCGFLVGLYLGKETRGLPSVRRKAAIIVREDAGRWTLVHEFMHHNFRTQAVERGYNHDVKEEQRAKLYSEIESLKKNRTLKDAEYASRLSELFQQLIDVVDEVIVHYQFEEVAIETLLQDKFEKAELTYVPFSSYENASAYVAASKKNIEEMYRGLTATYDELNRLTATNALIEDWRKLGRYVAMRDRRLAQLDKVIAKRKNLGMATAVGGSVSSLWEAPTTDYAPCAQAQAVENDLLRIAELMRKSR